MTHAPLASIMFLPEVNREGIVYVSYWYRTSVAGKGKY